MDIIFFLFLATIIGKEKWKNQIFFQDKCKKDIYCLTLFYLSVKSSQITSIYISFITQLTISEII